MKTEKFDVTGMTCASCVTHVEKSVSKLDGVKSVNVNLLTNSMTVTFDELHLNVAKIEDSVENAGYNARVHTYETNPYTATPKIDLVLQEQKSLKWRWLISCGFLIPLLYLSMAHMLGLPYPQAFDNMEYAFLSAFLQLWLAMPIIFVNRVYFKKGFKTLLKLAPNMDSLIAIGSSAAIVYGIYCLYRIYVGVMHFECTNGASLYT
ncbi:MAG: copper ion binding protein [Paludibacter sp.]